MNTPSPLIPQGTFPDKRGKSHVRIAVFTIMAIHVVLLSALLMAGCKKTTDTTAEATNALPAVFEPATNVFVPATPPPTTSIAAATTQVVSTAPAQPLGPTATEPTIPPPPAAADREHVVIKGDSFYTLAKQYNVTSRAITEANPGVDSTRLKIGQKIKIPPPTTPTASSAASNGTASSGEKTYTVKSGDTLWKIARDHGVTEKALRTVNNLKTTQIKVGQKLKIPAASEAATPVTPPTAPVP